MRGGKARRAAITGDEAELCGTQAGLGPVPHRRRMALPLRRSSSVIRPLSFRMIPMCSCYLLFTKHIKQNYRTLYYHLSEKKLPKSKFKLFISCFIVPYAFTVHWM